jgi:hypothetical protein
MIKLKPIFQCVTLLLVMGLAGCSASSTPPIPPAQAAQIGTSVTPPIPAAQAAQMGASVKPIDFCGIANFAWTIDGALARSAQPPHAAWLCLREQGFTTIIRQNIEGNQGEQSAVEQAGMQYVGSYTIPDQTAYAPAMLQAMIHDVVARLGHGERILVHDSGGRGRMGFWEATFLMWDGWSLRETIDRNIAFGWKIECAKGGNGQMQGLNEIAAAFEQPPYYPAEDSYGTAWKNCPRPTYMADWDYGTIRWPEERIKHSPGVAAQ